MIASPIEIDPAWVPGVAPGSYAVRWDAAERRMLKKPRPLLPRPPLGRVHLGAHAFRRIRRANATNLTPAAPVLSAAASCVSSAKT